MEKLLSLVDLFRKGSAVANPEVWKKHQVTATMLGVLIVAAVRAAKAMGYDLPIDEDSATAIGGGIVAVANIVLTYITSDKVGVLPARPADIVGTSNPTIQSDVPEAAPTIVPSKPVELVSETYLREAREALAARDAKQSTDNTYSGN